MPTKTEKVADALIRFCAEQKMNDAFVVAGGASLHLIHAVANRPESSYIPVHHEQSAAMAADAYTRSSGRPGIAIATSGPGATNLITGIAGAFYDSIPVLFLTGQVSTTRMVDDTGVRQIGFQETPIVDMVRQITKYAEQVTSAAQTRYVIERALWTMREGRPGPVLVDIPDNVQREMIIWDELESFTPPVIEDARVSELCIDELQELLDQSLRPVLIGGWGIHLANAEMEFRTFVEQLQIPTLLTWGAADLLEGDHTCRVGTFGTHGSRYANFCVQNSDLVIIVGSRLDTKATGSPVSTFARDAKKVMVDIDKFELNKFVKFDLHIDLKIQSDAKTFLKESLKIKANPSTHPRWMEQVRQSKAELQEFEESNRTSKPLEPYRFMKLLISSSPIENDFYLDTGCLLPWIFQDLSPKIGHRFFHDFNNTAMGWSLPALLGGLVASPNRSSIAVVGDGSFMMSLQELATLSPLNKPSKIVLIDNSGYSMIRQTQDQWLDSSYEASSGAGKLNFPNFALVAESFGYSYLQANADGDVDPVLQIFWDHPNDVILHVSINETARVSPQVRFGRPNEDMDPLLPRDIFIANMLIDPLPVSLEDM
jgi:acetolactate synthase-1/2/3 large subunit